MVKLNSTGILITSDTILQYLSNHLLVKIILWLSEYKVNCIYYREHDDSDLMLMSTPTQQKQSSRSVARHPAARALQEQVDGDGPQREAQVVDKMLFSPGEEGKVGGESLLPMYCPYSSLHMFNVHYLLFIRPYFRNFLINCNLDIA